MESYGNTDFRLGVLPAITRTRINRGLSPAQFRSLYFSFFLASTWVRSESSLYLTFEYDGRVSLVPARACIPSPRFSIFFRTRTRNTHLRKHICTLYNSDSSFDHFHSRSPPFLDSTTFEFPTPFSARSCIFIPFPVNVLAYSTKRVEYVLVRRACYVHYVRAVIPF